MPPAIRSQPATGEYRRSVPFAESRRTELVDRLARVVRAADLFEQNDDEMALPRPVTVRITVHHPGGGSARLLVFSHYVSPEGLWFLHSGFLHPGTRCVIVLPRGAEQEGGVLGSVEHCEHLERAVHAVGVRFDSHVDPEIFQGIMRSANTSKAAATVSLPSIRARVLLLDDQKSDNELVAFHLRSVGARLTAYTRVADALGDLQNEGFDLVLTELNLDEGPGEQAIDAMREAGYSGPVIILTSEQNVERLRRVRNAGAFAVIQKPYDPTLLIRTIAAAVSATQTALPSMSAVQSAAAEVQRLNPDMARLVHACLRRFECLARDLTAAAIANEQDDVRGLLAMLGGSPNTVNAAPDQPDVTQTAASLSALIADLSRRAAP